MTYYMEFQPHPLTCPESHSRPLACSESQPHPLIYMEYQPHPLLEGIIDNYWIKRTGATMTPHESENWITDLSMELIFHYGAPLLCDLSRSRTEIAAGSHLIGMRKQSMSLQRTGPIELIAVRFRPGGFTRLFGMPAAGFTNRIASAGEIWGAEARELTRQLYRLESDQARIALLDDRLLQLFDRGGPSAFYRDHPLLQTAIRRIYETEGTLPVQTICEELNTGYKKFQRLFHLHIGITPKLFCRIIRFHYAMNKLLGTSSHANEEQPAEIDPFYDQSHFIKEFQHFTGLTPRQLVTHRAKLSVQLANSERLSNFYNTKTAPPGMMIRNFNNKEMNCMEKLTPYIYCEDARKQADFYAKALGGQIASVQTYGDMPNATEETKDKVIHLVLKFGELQLFLADYSPLQSGNQMDLAVEFKTEEQAQAAFNGISKGGKVIFPLEKMAWGSMLGRVEDQFGIRWQIATV
ncbi:DUF6597 domain-containing transcriptional factor [Paenibacillus senegalensis]|uniref:DUF6597 domain-containing transcriptional factor n=1 Tax=Paenibacillus senegalensis TaxID=1465766 RepID=UPI00028A149F|nr:DUF6597 domain-containing transcriptional factor [Paenibacillus senegalensis]